MSKSRHTKAPPATPAATTARARNYIIMRLRGIYSCFSAMAIGNESVFDPSEIKQGQALIDQALTRLGAEPESSRREVWLERRRKAGAI